MTPEPEPLDPETHSGLKPNYSSVAQLDGHRRAIAAVKFSPSGALLASASADSTTRLWSAAARWSCVRVLNEHSQGINDVAWGHDASFLATASDDKTVKLWESEGHLTAAAAADSPHAHAQGDPVGGPALSTFSGHASYVFCCAFSPRGNHLLATGSYDETVKLWDVRTGRCCKTLPAHSDPVTAVDFSLDGTVVISASHDGLLRLWDVASGQCLKTIFAQPQSSAPVSFARYGSRDGVSHKDWVP
jgi:COMPASS component SWD3